MLRRVHWARTPSGRALRGGGRHAASCLRRRTCLSACSASFETNSGRRPIGSTRSDGMRTDVARAEDCRTQAARALPSACRHAALHAHSRARRRRCPANCWRSVSLEILPVAVWGISLTKTTSSGILHEGWRVAERCGDVSLRRLPADRAAAARTLGRPCQTSPPPQRTRPALHPALAHHHLAILPSK